MTMPDNKVHCAAFILREAAAAGIKVGTDGDEIVMLAPMRVPGDVRRWFERKLYEYREAVIAIIVLENAGGQS